jgi:hypothetical protein
VDAKEDHHRKQEGVTAKRGILLYSTKENLIKEARVSDDSHGTALGPMVRKRTLPPGRGIRTFRVDRIVELTLVDRTFEVPDDFDLHTRPRVSTRLRLSLDDRAVAALYQQIRREGKGD